MGQGWRVTRAETIRRTRAAAAADLPYGAVMATAGASTLAGLCGLPALIAPLLALAALQAASVAASAAQKYRHSRRLFWPAVGPPDAHTGIHTVPLGLAVIAGGFANLDGAAVPQLAWALFGLTWLLACVYIGRFVWSLATRGLELERVDGAWFLVPAALLGAALATLDILALAPGSSRRALVLLALVGAASGWLGYWAVAVPAALRVGRFGLLGAPQAPWWIAMGCAGLAAAATGDVLERGAPWPRALHAALAWATGATILVAIALCVPVFAGSAAFLMRRCRFRDAGAWPPTFSTAVFALGCLEAGTVLQSPALRMLGFAAGIATLVLWIGTAGWNAARWAIARVTRHDGTDAR